MVFTLLVVLILLLSCDLVEDQKSNEEDAKRTCEKSPAGECKYEYIWFCHISTSLAEYREKLRKEESSGENGCDLSGYIGTKSERKQVILLVGLDTDLLDNTGRHREC